MNIVPRGKQEEVMALPAKGHIVVLGTAGSGKTTIALLRAYHLANIPDAGKVLLVTFNRALVKYMEAIKNFQSKNLVVENYHKYARGYLKSRGKILHGNIIVSSMEKEKYIEKALQDLSLKYPLESTYKRSKDFFLEEISFIEKFGLVNFEEYKKAERIGRAASNIKRENRKWVFYLFEKYIELRENDGKKYDWDDMAYYVFNELKIDVNRRYSHIIIDEGQDFSPMMIKSLVESVDKNGSFTFFGDVAQQIYGSRLSWRDSGIDVSKVWKFDINYRNPESIMKFAKAITQNKYWKKDKDMIEATTQIAKGPKPVLIEFLNEQEEIMWIVKQAIEVGKTASTVIICKKRYEIDMLLYKLKEKGCIGIEIDKNTPGFADEKKVYLSTYYAAKGLEFDNVFIPFLSKKRFSSFDNILQTESENEFYADRIKLLYVAATRSKYGLYMSYSGELTQLFPKKSNTYDFYKGVDL